MVPYLKKIRLIMQPYIWSRLLIHSRCMEGAHDLLGNTVNTDSIHQAKREPGQAQVPTSILETNKQSNLIFSKVPDPKKISS